MLRWLGAGMLCAGVLALSSCAPSSQAELYNEAGEPIVGHLETREGTIELTADRFDAEKPEDGKGLDLQEMRAREITADVQPDYTDAR